MDSEKEIPREDINDVQVFEGDEALRLVGTEAHKFSEDYNRRLRNKLVRRVRAHYTILALLTDQQDKVIVPITAAVYFTQFL